MKGCYLKTFVPGLALLLQINFVTADLAKRSSKSLGIFDQLTDPNVYDSRDPPYSKGPIQVETSVTVTILTGIQTQSSEFSSQFVIQHVWMDSRLSFSDIPDHPSSLNGEQGFAEKIWKPSIYVVNEKASSIITVPQANVLVSIYPNGTVVFSYRQRSGVYCALNLMKFPFDRQKCSIYFESWSLINDELTLHWKEGSGIEIYEKFPMLEFSLLGYKSWNTTHHRFHGHNYSMLVLEFYLAREAGYYVLDFYVPAIFLVILSWVSFWLEATAVPARVTIGSSSMLTFITLSRNLSTSLPKVSYIKAVDIYVLMCLCFIFASLIEFAFVNSISRRRSAEMELKKLTTGHVIKRALTPTPSPSRRSSFIPTTKSDENYTEINELSLESVDQNANQTRRRTFSNDLTLRVTDLWERGKVLTTSNSCPNLKVDHENIDDDCQSISIPVPTISKDLENISGSISLQVPKLEPKKKPVQKMSTHEIAKYLDRRSRIFFPVLFFLSNVLYWSLVWI